MTRKKEMVLCYMMMILAISVYALAGPVPDTGQTKCYDDGSEIPCPQLGEDFYGQDANYNINPPSYTKLDAQGNELPDSAAEWVMVRDNVTGLIWEVKQAKDEIADYSNPHDADNYYTWYDSNPETNNGDAGIPGDGTDTEDFINALNAKNFGGYSDWRLPNPQELSSISYLEKGNTCPAINTNYFPHTQSPHQSRYWSSSTIYFKTDDRYFAFCVTFCDGEPIKYTRKSLTSYVCAVRNQKAEVSDHLILNNDDGTYTDTKTGLMWQQDIDERMNWKDALLYCENLSLSAYNDWRLPNKEELLSIVNYEKGYYKIPFPHNKNFWYWSSTTPAPGDGIWALSIRGTFVLDEYMKTNTCYTRSVRGGQHQIAGHIIISKPYQASNWYARAPMTVKWATQDIPGNVRISLSREGGKDNTFETITESTENDGTYEWTITEPASVNCVLKIEPLDDPSKGTTQGLFTIRLPFATISDAPDTSTNQTTATFTIGGDFITAYKYKWNDGSYSNEISVSTPINLSGLSEGNHTVYVIGKDTFGVWQDSEAPTTFSWLVDTTLPTISINQPTDGATVTTDLTAIDGIASDESSGVSQVELQVVDKDGWFLTTGESGNKYFDQSEAWLPLTGTSSWVFPTNDVRWGDNTAFTVTARATDKAGNIGTNTIQFDTSNYEASELDPSSITCNLSKNDIVLGEPLRIWAEISPQPDEAATSISITLVSPEGSVRNITVSASTDGQFSHDLDCGDITRSGQWSIRTSWDGNETLQKALSNYQYLEVSKARMVVHPQVTSQSIRFGDQITVGGKLRPEPDCGEVAPGTQVRMKISHAGGTEYEKTLTADEWGYFKLEPEDAEYQGFDELGDWTVQFFSEGNDAYELSDSESLKVKVTEAVGYAVIVQGKNIHEEGLASHNKTTNFVYGILRDRGFSDEDIKYFNYDTDQTDDQDNPIVDASPSKTAIGEAIKIWARDEMNKKPADLFIVLVNHGLRENFEIYPDSISSEELGGWLNTLQIGLEDEARQQNIIVVLGFCHSGSFMDNLYHADSSSENNRIIIASAAANESSYKGPDEGDRDEYGNIIRDGEYFVTQFFKSASYGKSVKQSFEDAVFLTETFTASGAATSWNAPYFDNSLQHPLLDDSGDGVGSNELTDPDGDGFLSESVFVGVMDAATVNDPGDVRVTRTGAEAQFLNADENAVTLWAEVSDSSRVKTIWCEIKPPDYSRPQSGGSEQIGMDLVRISHTHTDTDSGRYEWRFSGTGPDDPDFSVPGTYRIFFFAEDIISGNISPLAEMKVYKAKIGNTPPWPFSLVSPADAAYGKTVSTTPILDWEDTKDPDGDRMHYMVLISELAFDDPNYVPENTIRKEVRGCSTCLVEPDGGLNDLKYYYWKVQAIDEYGGLRESDTRIFQTDNHDNPIPAWIGGHVYNAVTGRPLTGAVVSISDSGNSVLSELLSDAGGCYLGNVPDEANMVSTAANNYASATWPISNYLETGDTGKDYRPGDLMTKHFGLGCDIIVKGDINGDCFVDMNDAVLALQTAAEMEIFVDVHTEADANDDGEIGLAEGVYVLKLISGGS